MSDFLIKIVGGIIFIFVFSWVSINVFPEIQEGVMGEQEDIPEDSFVCEKDEDCIVFGETGDCNCGCYNKNSLPTSTGGNCFCLAPVSCECLDGKCEGVFIEEINNFEECVGLGFPVMESYPRQCTAYGETFTENYCMKEGSGDLITLSDAREVAIESECGDRLKDNFSCNEITGTYWIDLEIEKEGCNPACVVDVGERTAVINWRCTGLLQ